MASVELIPDPILFPTAKMEARTPAAPLIPQNHGVGFLSIREISRIPVGKANPINNPAGAIVNTQIEALTINLALSKLRNTSGNQSGKVNI